MHNRVPYVTAPYFVESSQRLTLYLSVMTQNDKSSKNIDLLLLI